MHTVTFFLSACFVMIVAYYLFASPSIKCNGKALRQVIPNTKSPAYEYRCSRSVFYFLLRLPLSRLDTSYRNKTDHDLRRPPDTLPLVGNGIRFLQARHKLFSWFVKCEQQFGFETLQISVPSLPPGVLINDPKNLEYVLRNEGIFAKGDFFKSRSWDLFGKDQYHPVIWHQTLDLPL